jgi:ankyrin repeat protein
MPNFFIVFIFSILSFFTYASLNVSLAAGAAGFAPAQDNEFPSLSAPAATTNPNNIPQQQPMSSSSGNQVWGNNQSTPSSGGVAPMPSPQPVTVMPESINTSNTTGTNHLKKSSSSANDPDLDEYEISEPDEDSFEKDLPADKKKLLQRQKEWEEKRKKDSKRIEKLLKQNYKTQVLPEVIYKKEYNKENQHLPKVVYYSEYDNHAFQAVEKGELEALQALISVLDTVDIRNDLGDTLLSQAIKLNHLHLVNTLIANGANVNSINNDGLSIINLAINTADIGLIKSLLNTNIELNVKDNLGRNAADYARKAGNDEIVQLIEEAIRKKSEVKTVKKSAVKKKAKPAVEMTPIPPVSNDLPKEQKKEENVTPNEAPKEAPKDISKETKPEQGFSINK